MENEAVIKEKDGEIVKKRVELGEVQAELEETLKAAREREEELERLKQELDNQEVSVRVVVLELCNCCCSCR